MITPTSTDIVIVYPQGTAFVSDSGEPITSWNDLTCSGSPGPEGPICSDTAFEYPFPPECGEPTDCTWCTCHDDLAFVRQLLDSLEETLCVDLDRVYATGMSNGGMFVHRLGYAIPDRFAAIAPVAGTLARGFNCAPETQTPLSVMNIYGRRDRYVDQVNPVSSDGYFYTSAEDVMMKWAGYDSQMCTAEPTPYETSQTGVLGIRCVEYEGCNTGAEVVSCSWAGPHSWPQNPVQDPGNEIIWEFFSKHSRADYRIPE